MYIIDHKDMIENATANIMNSLSDVPRATAEQILGRCYSQAKNCRLLEEMTKGSEIKLSGFHANAELELYYDIEWNSIDVGLISKGWTEPGFRIANTMILSDQAVGRFQAGVMDLLRFISGEGIVITGKLTGKGYELMYDYVIYSEGFNQTVFMKTLKTLNECTKKIREVVG